jgi:hypothetical protein
MTYCSSWALCTLCFSSIGRLKLLYFGYLTKNSHCTFLDDIKAVRDIPRSKINLVCVILLHIPRARAVQFMMDFKSSASFHATGHLRDTG